ncbi:methylenetetrahydrofolate reductase [Sphingomonas oryzagri]|uniref:Methylenetetrahydrofolate reductase n=1 Tax=Sphingomonas oryzagri TaxID=3042314 RepID=A0ABT6N1W2_9SPHN|nr:methylenetetrahydrofolate reductase [Sphingomonas oryzagri]MDH7639286.1 methylenetetrahydrofolate reductase [Sphingomonas oryzagri]
MTTLSALLQDYSIEATAKDAAASAILPPAMPRPAQVFVPYLHEESDEMRIAACTRIRDAGLEPVPHISARRVAGIAELDRLLGALRERAQVDSLFLIAGDIAHVDGPFEDSLSVIRSGLIERHGIRHVGIAGHPEGHPAVIENALWDAMVAKIDALGERGLDSQIVTQFSFDAGQVLRWLHGVRARGVAVPVRVGIPGPTSVRTLLRYAVRCGVSASASAVGKYGLSLGRLLGHAGPDAFLEDLEADLDPAVTGDVRLHIFPFGGFDKVSDWLIDQLAHEPASSSFAA